MIRHAMRWLLPAASAVALTACCGIPHYSPDFWNDSGTVQFNNNCYNYGNNKRTDTYAQPGRFAGAMYPQPITCTGVYNAAVADGLKPLPPTGTCADNLAKVALVVSPGSTFNDFHWYRLGNDSMWSHKPGGGQATNLDNSGHLIASPETANRGPYTDFCGYLCTCSDTEQGNGHERIK